jgi:hypothetical protein
MLKALDRSHPTTLAALLVLAVLAELGNGRDSLALSESARISAV